MGARVTSRKDFAGRRRTLLAAVDRARQLISETADEDGSAVRRAACNVFDDVEAQIHSGAGLNPNTLPNTTERTLYAPLRQFFHDDVPNQLVRRISRAQEDGLSALAELLYNSYTDPTLIKRSVTPGLVSGAEVVAEQCRQDVINIAEYLQHIFDISIAATPVRRSARDLRPGGGVLRTEQKNVPEAYCLLCLYRPSQQHQALTEYRVSVARKGSKAIEHFVLGNRVPKGAELELGVEHLDSDAEKLSHMYCDLHAGGSPEARALRRYATRHKADMAAAQHMSIGTSLSSDHDCRLIRFLNGRPTRIAEEVHRLESALSMYRPDIDSLLSYHLDTMPIPLAVRERFVVTDRFAGLVIQSSGSAYCVDIDREIVARFDVSSPGELTSWSESFERLRSLSRYVPDGLEHGDDFWITRSDPSRAHIRVAIANIAFWSTWQCTTARTSEKINDKLGITVTSPEWLRRMTSGMSHQHPTPCPRKP